MLGTDASLFKLVSCRSKVGGLSNCAPVYRMAAVCLVVEAGSSVNRIWLVQ
jgi:hypothetical protein